MGADDGLQLGLEGGIRGGLPAGSPREKLAHDIGLPTRGCGGCLASLGRGTCRRAHLAGGLGERPGILEPLAQLAPLRKDLDAFEEAVRMEVVEIADLDPRTAPLSERQVHRHLQTAELLLEDVPVDGVQLSRRERAGAGAAEITEDEEAKGCFGVERLGRRLGSAPQPHVDFAGRRALGHRGLLEMDPKSSAEEYPRRLRPMIAFPHVARRADRTRRGHVPWAAVFSDPSGSSRDDRGVVWPSRRSSRALSRTRAGLRAGGQSHPDGLCPSGEHLPRPRRGRLGCCAGPRADFHPRPHERDSRSRRSPGRVRTSARSTTSSRTASTRGCRRPCRKGCSRSPPRCSLRTASRM